MFILPRYCWSFVNILAYIGCFGCFVVANACAPFSGTFLPQGKLEVPYSFGVTERCTTEETTWIPSLHTLKPHLFVEQEIKNRRALGWVHDPQYYQILHSEEDFRKLSLNSCLSKEKISSFDWNNKKLLLMRYNGTGVSMMLQGLSYDAPSNTLEISMSSTRGCYGTAPPHEIEQRFIEVPKEWLAPVNLGTTVMLVVENVYHECGPVP